MKSQKAIWGCIVAAVWIEDSKLPIIPSIQQFLIRGGGGGGDDGACTQNALFVFWVHSPDPEIFIIKGEMEREERPEINHQREWINEPRVPVRLGSEAVDSRPE